jgi:hypothetical protein
MKTLILFFVSLFIINSLTQAAIIHSKGDGSLAGSVTSAGIATGGGLWSDVTTWQEGVAPVAGDEVFILSGDLVKVGATANALNLTVQNGGMVFQGASVTGTGTFTLASGSTWYAAYSSATKLPQGFVTYSIDANSNWIICSNASSSLINLPPALYGNLTVYKGGSVLAAITGLTNPVSSDNINIQGNLTIATGTASSAVKGANNKSDASVIIHVGGNVNIISGTLSGVDAVNQATTCTFNIDGNVTVGDASPILSGLAVLAPVSGADAGQQRTGIFNIKGNLSYINGAKFEAGTSGSSTNVLESAVINLKGNLTTDATVVNALNTPGIFSLNLVGTGNQILTLGIPLDFTPATSFVLKINNPAGVTLNSPAKVVKATLNLSSGNLTTTSSNNLILGQGSSITGGSSSSFINGPLAFAVKSTSPVSFIYPIGKSSVFSPLSLTLTQNTVDSSVYTAELFNSAPPANSLPGALDKVSTIRYYKISESTGGTSFTTGSVLLNYSGNDGVTDASNLRIAQGSTTGSGTWIDLGGSGSGVPAGTITSTNSFTDLTNNTIFTLANHTGGSNSLPVELTSFAVINNSRNVQINWVTGTEKNCSNFEIERAMVRTNSESLAWVKVGSVSASGTSTSPKSYSYTDKNIQSGKYQYRLKMIDYDGSANYSNIEVTEIASPKNFELSQNYPNPFNPSTTIAYQIPVDAKVIMEVYNIAGQKVSELVNQDMSAGYYSVNFGESKLSTGIYIYRMVAVDKVTGNNFSVVKKMMLLK